MTPLKKATIIFTCLMFTVFTAACDNYPKDEAQTLEKIYQTKEIHIGVVYNPPWADHTNKKFNGIEVEIIKKFADHLHVSPRFIRLSEADAIESLNKHQIDLAIGGFTKDTPYKKETGLTRPYFKTGNNKKNAHVIAAPKGENALITKLEKFLKSEEVNIKKLYEGAKEHL